MNKRIIYLLVLFMILAGCGETGKEVEQAGDKELESVTESESVEGDTIEEIVFELSYEDPDSIDFLAPDLSYGGDAIVITSKETVKRKDEYSHFLIHEREFIETRDLSSEEPSRRCSNNYLTPDGTHLAFQCPVDGVDFAVYSLQSGELVYESLEKVETDYRAELLAVTNDLQVVLETQSSDREDQLTIYDISTEVQTDYLIKDLLNEESQGVSSITLTYDGTEMLIDTVTGLYIFNIVTEDMEEIIDLESTYHQKYEDDFIFINAADLSPNGRYLIYTISGDPFKGYFFLDRETGEERMYQEFEYSRQANISDQAEVIVSDSNGMYLFNYETETLLAIPGLTGREDHARLSGDGNVLYYTAEKMNNDGDERTAVVNKVYLQNKEGFEQVPFNAVYEETESVVSQQQFTLVEKQQNEIHEINELWEESRELQFISDFPGEVISFNYSTSQNSSINELTVEMLIEGVNSYSNPEVTVRVTERSADSCIDNDLELLDTINGVEYYFYQFTESGNELGYFVDGYCYRQEGKNVDEDMMLDMALSNEPLGDRIPEIEPADMKFPSLFLGESLEYDSATIIYNEEEEAQDQFQFMIRYRADREIEEDISMDLHILNFEPRSLKDLEQKVAADNQFEEAYFDEERLELYVSDGNYYYKLSADFPDELIEGTSASELQDILLQIANSMN